MPHIQFSFLGRSHSRAGEYMKASYRFADNTVRETPLFALALARQCRPDAIVLFGTAGSSWHSFLDWAGYAEGDVSAAAALQARLQEAGKSSAVSVADLAELEALALPVEGTPWRLRLIPLCQTSEEVEELLSLMAREVHPGDAVSLDVTHGLRHLPMLSLLAALYLRKVRKVHVKDIVYGALELSAAVEPNGPALTPVLELHRVLEIASWLDAISHFEASGDYAQFGKLLPESKATLRRASFYQSTHQFTRFQDELRKLQPALEDQGDLLLQLFKPALASHLAAAANGEELQVQRAMAEAALNRKDFLRAAIFTLEAFTSRLMPSGKHGTYQERSQRLGDFISGDGEHEARQVLKLKPGEPGRMRDYARELRTVRNALAHAGETKAGGKFLLRHDDPWKNEASLQAFLEHAIRILLPEPK